MHPLYLSQLHHFIRFIESGGHTKNYQRSIRQIIQHAAMFSLHRFKKSFNQAHFFPCLVIEIRFNVFAARIFKMCVINVSYD